MSRLIDADRLKREFPKDGDWEYPVNTNEHVCEVIDAQPSAQPDLSSYSDKLWRAAYERGKAEAQRWIPCNERLPRIEENPVLVSWMGLVNIGWYNPVDGWITGTRFEVDEVDAWMPLPDPWKEGQDGNS